MLEPLKVYDDIDLASVRMYLSDGDPLVNNEIMDPPKPSLRQLFERLAVEDRHRIKCLAELMELNLKFITRKGAPLNGKIWLISKEYRTAHLIDKNDPLKTSYPVLFDLLKDLNPDLVSQLSVLDTE